MIMSDTIAAIATGGAARVAAGGEIPVDAAIVGIIDP